MKTVGPTSLFQPTNWACDDVLINFRSQEATVNGESLIGGPLTDNPCNIAIPA